MCTEAVDPEPRASLTVTARPGTGSAAQPRGGERLRAGGSGARPHAHGQHRETEQLCVHSCPHPQGVSNSYKDCSYSLTPRIKFC